MPSPNSVATALEANGVSAGAARVSEGGRMFEVRPWNRIRSTRPGTPAVRKLDRSSSSGFMPLSRWNSTVSPETERPTRALGGPSS